MESNITTWENIPQVIDVTTCSLIFGVDPITVRNWIAKDKLHSFKVGRKYFFDKDYLISVTKNQKGKYTND